MRAEAFRSRHRRRILTLAAAIFACLLLLGIGLLLPMQEDSAPNSKPVAPDAADVPRAEGARPCLDAKSTSVSNLWKASRSLPAVMPHDDLASPRSVEGAWSCAGGTAAVVKFTSGIQMTMDSGWIVSNEQAMLSNFAKDWAVGTVRSVGGRTSLVIPRGPRSSNGEVAFFDGGTLVTIDGDGHRDVDQLSRIASSVN
jgi:hypothetical protein